MKDVAHGPHVLGVCKKRTGKPLLNWIATFWYIYLSTLLGQHFLFHYSCIFHHLLSLIVGWHWLDEYSCIKKEIEQTASDLIVLRTYRMNYWESWKRSLEVWSMANWLKPLEDQFSVLLFTYKIYYNTLLWLFHVSLQPI